MNTRKLTSLLLAWSFVILSITSIVLYITPAGRVAYWASWSLFGLDKHQWGALHTNIGYLFIAASVIHIILNWKLIVNYIRKKTREAMKINADTVASVVIVMAFSVLTLAEMPPVSWIQTFGEGLKEVSEVKYGSPPYGHAEMSSLELYCQRTGTDVEEAKRLLAEAGIAYTGPDQSIADIATANNLTPQDIAKVITPGQVEVASLGGFGTGKRMGMMTIAQVSEASGLPVAEIEAKLSAAGYSIEPGKTLKEIAAAKGAHPSQLVTMLGLEEEH